MVVLLAPDQRKRFRSFPPSTSQTTASVFSVGSNRDRRSVCPSGEKQTGEKDRSEARPLFRCSTSLVGSCSCNGVAPSRRIAVPAQRSRARLSCFFVRTIKLGLKSPRSGI